MHRIIELVKEVRARYPEDDFFSEFESSCRVNRLKREFYLAYENALVELDELAWGALKEKSLRHFKNHRDGQLKTGFFAQLNEAFAYRYLVSHGFSNVTFLPEGRTKQPDLRFKTESNICFCEVKSIGISDEEINRRGSHECIDGSVYARLSSGFLGKLEDKIKTAKEQLGGLSDQKIVYVMVEFDDFTHDYFAEYREQLEHFITGYPPACVILQMGLLGDTVSL